MTSSLRLLSALTSPAFALVLACGGSETRPVEASKPAASAAAARAPSEAAERCLAVAGAARKRKTIEAKSITAKHVLVKFQGAKNASAKIVRSREDACLRAEEARGKLEGGASFAEVVGTYSDEAGAATREGSIGAIERSNVAPAFADAAFELEIGQVSYVVETEFGFHVIQRTE